MMTASTTLDSGNETPSSIPAKSATTTTTSEIIRQRQGQVSNSSIDVNNCNQFPPDRGDLNVFYRLILYGLCGLAVEITFTAMWQAIEHGNRKLHGITSIYAFIIYGVSAFVVESVYVRMHDYRWYVRGLIYLIWTYSWEFSTGLFLRQFDACPWDYEPYFKGHIMGLITMEYAPLWYVGSMFQERLIVRNALRLSWKRNEKKTQ